MRQKWIIIRIIGVEKKRVLEDKTYDSRDDAQLAANAYAAGFELTSGIKPICKPQLLKGRE